MPKGKILPSTSKASPAAYKAVSVARVAAGKAGLKNAPEASVEVWKSGACDSSLAEPSVRLYKLLDKLDKHCVDFATLLKFFEFFGWSGDAGGNMHDAWVEDWHDILKFLGGLSVKTSSLRIDQFVQLVSHPNRPPLLLDYTVDQMLYHVQQSYLARPIVLLPPMSGVDVDECRIFAEWFVRVNQTNCLVEHLGSMVERSPRNKAMLEPDGVFFMYWYFCIFGDALNQFFENWQNPATGSTAVVPWAPPVELPSGSLVSSTEGMRVYEQFRVCWMLFEGAWYLMLNLWDLDNDFFSNVRWWVEESHRWAKNGAHAVILDASAVPGMPDCLCMGECDGLKSMVQAKTKKRRRQGIWAAMYLHYLLKHPRQDRGESYTCFDANLMEWVDCILMNPYSVDFDTNMIVERDHGEVSG